MKHFYFRKNETDFYRWCRHYVHKALVDVKMYEGTNGDVYLLHNLDKYMESIVIKRQYEVLLASLSEFEQQFFLKKLIGKENRVWGNKQENYAYTNIYNNWKQICFPNNCSKIKTINKERMGKVLRYYREFNCLSLKEVSEMICVASETIKSYELGRRLVRSDVLFCLSQLYNVNIEDLIEESIPENLKVL